MKTAITQFANTRPGPAEADQTPYDRRLDQGLRRHMLRVYNYMGVGLVITGVVAYLVGTTPTLYEAVLTPPFFWVAILAPLAFIVIFSFSINAISGPAAQVLFWAFCALMGLSLALVLLLFTGTSIARTFFIAAAMFGAMSIYGYTTRTDLTRFRSFLIMGLVGVLVALVVNLFVASDALHVAVSLIGIAVFLGLTALDTQTIREQYTASGATENHQKLAVLGALSLYLSFVNLFQFLLTFTGESRE